MGVPHRAYPLSPCGALLTLIAMNLPLVQLDVVQGVR